MGVVEQPSATRTASLDGSAPNLCWLLSQASHVLTTKLTAALEETGLSPRAQHVLCAASRGEHTQIELARMSGLDKTTMVVTMDELEAAGLAERRRSAKDRRARVIHVTEAGRALLQRTNEIVERMHAAVLAELPEEERGPFTSALLRLAEGPLAEPASCAHPVRRRS